MNWIIHNRINPPNNHRKFRQLHHRKHYPIIGIIVH
ncbi:hypothetical protein BLA29_013904 [Euroglyphus maynei]|uniref:Uncharacterized protein n=1 Tax=Euroglyphus maynei TaxID=6958 RepID=A0A1Y3BF24_EURMA|nr:hypothetical protein BLA29_013904 [Euroglyphus maynei]